MDLNPYKSFSESYSTETLATTDMDRINAFCKLETIEEAKAYLSQAFNITRPVKNYSISKNCSLSVIDRGKIFAIEFYLQKETQIFSYLKEG